MTINLRKEGPGVVCVKDIDLPHDVEIINPEHVIAHLAAGGKLDMQIKVEKGRGYVPGNMRQYQDEATKLIGRIVLDASFSPINRVSYAVESARVEQRTDLDRLVMTIETNGVISPEESIRQAASILVDQLVESPFVTALIIFSIAEFRARSALAFESSASSAIFSTSSALFIFFL